MKNKLKKIFLLSGDIIILYLSLYLTLFLRYWKTPSAETWTSHLAPFSFIFFFWIFIFYIFNLYNINLAANTRNFIKNTGKCLIASFLFSIAFFYLIPNIGISPKRNLLIYIVVFAVLFYFWRMFFNWSLKSYLPKSNLAIIGINNLSEELISEFEKKPFLGFAIKFLIDGDEKKSINNIPIYRSIDGLKNLLAQHNINTVILGQETEQSEKLRKVLFESLSLKINFISLPKIYENITGKIPVNVINRSWFLENLNEGDKKSFDIFKRGYDLALALFILTLTIIFWPLISLIIKLESRGPIFIKMPRIGEGGKVFTMYKFRTMREEGNHRGITVENDPRITKFGKLIRKTRIDELPQIINILKGEMSFVGPRPERPELAEELEKIIPFFNERALVKPGLTGWDQVSGEYHSPTYEDTLKKIQYDLFYIKNRSVYLDLSIILKTISTIISREGR